MDLVQSEVSPSHIKTLYADRFGHDPAVVAAAPGRVNLIGEHTDYNNGFVMPMALECYTIVAVGPSPSGAYRFSSTFGDVVVELSEEEAFRKGDPFWTNYIRGVLVLLRRRGANITPVDLLVDSNIPRGGGLSSSAAMEVAAITALAEYVGMKLDKMEIALMGQQVEHEFANVPCGIMDQFVSSHGREGHALKLDCRSMEYEDIPLNDPAVSVLIIDSAVKHSLADGAYAQRRKQCEDAARTLGVTSLRETSLADLELHREKLGDICYRRARHVVGENARVQAFARAVSKGDWDEAGGIMRGSHASLRDDYEVSCAEVDALIGICDTIPSASSIYGARITGAGFGGCIVALVKTSKVEQVAEEILSAYCEITGIDTTYLITRAGDGARVIS